MQKIRYRVYEITIIHRKQAVFVNKIKLLGLNNILK